MKWATNVRREEGASTTEASGAPGKSEIRPLEATYRQAPVLVLRPISECRPNAALVRIKLIILMYCASDMILLNTPSFADVANGEIGS